MKSEDSLHEELNNDNDSNFGGKGKLNRRRVIRRKNANVVRYVQINKELANVNQYDNINFDINNDVIEEDESDVKACFKISLLTNASYNRIYATIRQALLDQYFFNQYSTSNKISSHLLASNNQFTSSFDHLLEEEIKFGQFCLKNIPKVVSLGLNVVFDIIKDSYENNPKICIRSLESLYNLLQGLKPESLKYEPSHIIEKYFDLILTLISFSYSSITRKYITNSSNIYDNYHSQVLELSILSYITLTIARGETYKILNCIKTLLIKCNDTNILLDNYNVFNSIFKIEIPEILVLLNKKVCSLLLGKFNISEWYNIGFPAKSLCEKFSLDFNYVKANYSKPSINFKSKSNCSTSFTFDGQFLILYRCNQIYLIGSGYNNTPIGQILFSSSIDSTNFKDNSTVNHTKCCSHDCWVGYINGELFLQPHSNWSSNQIMHLDARTFKLKSIVQLISDYSSNLNKSPFVNPTLGTTDGDYLILITVIQDDYFIIRELKPLKKKLDCKSLYGKENVSFSISSEFKIQLSSVCFSFAGSSVHNFVLPTKSLIKESSDVFDETSHKSNTYISSQMRLVDCSNLCTTKNIVNIITGKDFALMLTDQGKIYYTGNSQSLGIRHLYSFDKWSLLNIPKPVKIIQISVGHEGSHALLLGEEGTVFFVGMAKKGEDGETSSRPCRFSKPCRVKKFSKLDSSLNPVFIACNHGTSAIISKTGDLYLFGKDAQHANYKGLVGSILKDFTIKSVAIGKAHLLILTSNGTLITSGFSNKGQCGFNQNIAQGFNSKQHTTNGLNNRDQKPRQTFVHGKPLKCKSCLNTTESSRHDSKSSLIVPGICGCGEESSGCVSCNICTVCFKHMPFCINKNEVNADKYDDEDYLMKKPLVTTSDSAKPNIVTFNNPSQYMASKCMSSVIVNETELDCEGSSKIASIAPTILPLSQNVPIMQIAAGLHHSVVLTEAGEVFTFGSNQFGQLGHGDFNNRYIPTRVRTEDVTKGCVTQIATGSNHTVLLTSLGEVLTFGNNQNGQLGRECYGSCKLSYTWNTFPAKIRDIGPEYGRIATFISASGDFTFVKYEEILLSSNLFGYAKLIVEKDNLILIPPNINYFKTFDELFEEKSCKHECCKPAESNVENFQDQNVFNNLNTNILIISRSKGTCSILNSLNITKSLKFLNQFDIKNQLNFGNYSSIFIDKFYNNLWTFNSHCDAFERFNLMALETSINIAKTLNEVQKCDNHFKFPSSLFSLYQLNTLNHSTSQIMKNIPSSIQPDIAIPLTDSCLLRQTPQQLGIELFSFFATLTHSQFLGLSVNDKLDQLNHLTRNFLPEDYLQVCRFEDFGGGWGYPPHSVEALRFSVDCDIILGGIGLYGGRGEYCVQIRLFDLGFDGGELEKEGELLTETDIIQYECLPRQKYQIFFDDPILIQANRWYVIWAFINGPSSDCGSSGQPFVCTSDQIMFHFKHSKLSNNGTDVNSGQIPVLFYKAVRSNDFTFQYNNNNSTNFTSLSVDDEGLPFSISKDFVMQINSQCLDSLCEILRYVWNALKSLYNPERFNEIFSSEDEEKYSDKLNNLISEIKKILYIACFVFELTRVYVQILLPFKENNSVKTNNSTNMFQQFSQMQKFLHFDYDEYKRIANSLYEICTLLTSILINPIDVIKVIMENFNMNNLKISTKNKFLVLIKMNNFFIEECHQTFLHCCYAFYPTNSLKWSLLCELLSPEPSQESFDMMNKVDNEDKNIFTNKQLYLLSAVIQAFCDPTIKLISFFPLSKGCITESFENQIDSKDVSKPISDFSDISCHVISKKLSEAFLYGDLYLDSNYSCQFIFDNLLNIIIEPVRTSIKNWNIIRNKIEKNEPFYLNDYRQFGIYSSEQCEANFRDLSTSISSSSSSSFEEEINNINNLIDSNCLSTNDCEFTEEPCESSSKAKLSILNMKQIYLKKLVNSACDMLIKFISEFDACSLGFLKNQLNVDLKTLFLTHTEYITPSRFCRRSSSKCWEAGSGSPEAICFSVNKAGIYISGVRVYSSTMGQFKYQLQLLDQEYEDSKIEKNNLKWKTLTLVSGVYSSEDNNQVKLSDVCEIRFERPVVVLPNVKYAILFKNYSNYSFNGDMGLPQVRGDDDTLFTFMDCSLSKNGTNLNRGQIPQILYYNVPDEQLKSSQNVSKNPNNSIDLKSRLNVNTFDINLVQHSIVSMFKSTIDQANNLLKSNNELISKYIENSSDTTTSTSQSSISKNKNPSSHLIFSDTQLLELVYSLFDSVFYRKFIPNFIMLVNNILTSPSFSYEILQSIQPIVPSISTMHRLISNHLSHMESGSLITTSSYYLIVESDHPYKPTSVTPYFVKFPPSVKWIAIEFDPKCSTAQPEDYLEIYIPNENFNNFSSFDFNAEESYSSNSSNSSTSFKNLTLVHKKFSGKNFSILPSENLDKQFFGGYNRQTSKPSLSNNILLPGNELVFVLKTSSDYVHSGGPSDDAYYGFRAQVTGYELPSKMNYIKDLTNSDSSTLNKETMFQCVKHMIQNFENDIVYLFGHCVNTLINSSPAHIINNVIDKHNSEGTNIMDLKQSPMWLKHFDSNVDIDLAKQIFCDNFSILHKSLNFEQPLTTKMILNFDFPTSNVHSFLDDFIRLNSSSSGARLALWFQSESFILPNSCIVNTIDLVDFCCDLCAQYLEGNLQESRKLCSRCHYQFFVKTLSQSPDYKNAFIGKKFFITIVTRDQNEEIGYDPNACVEVNIRFVSPFSDDNTLDSEKLFGFEPSKENDNLKDKLCDKSPLLNLISQNPYQVTTKDKLRYHSMTMMKAFENYTLEELRFYTHSLFKKKTILENLSVRSFENGYYLASWTPMSTGCYKIELIVDGEMSSNTYLININNLPDSYAKSYNSKCVTNSPMITSNAEGRKHTKIKFDSQEVCSSFGASSFHETERPKVKHSIRKFICHDTAGLRIRALPSLQSEQIGIVAVNGLLTIVDQFENDDGIWVRLSNESIQAYCSSSADMYNTSIPKDPFISDNFEVNLNDFISSNMKSSFTFTFRTEAWALQYNRHFNRTLLVSIDSEDDIASQQLYLKKNFVKNNKTETLVVPSMLQVVNCGPDGHLIRNTPSLDETSIIMGTVLLNDTVNAVETVQNDFGVWVRLSQDSFYPNINAFYQTAYFESKIEGWMLAQSLTGLVYLQSAHQLNQESVGDRDNEQKYPEILANNNSKYNLFDDNSYTVQPKKAISNSAAQCVRAIFAAFVWHEGILHDLLTAASYLKFNTEITRDYVNCQNLPANSKNDKSLSKPSVNFSRLNRSNRKGNRSQKTTFRHSVEVSQLLTLWSSDVNSNISDMINSALAENNNNNNNNNEDSVSNSNHEDSFDENIFLIPEILINLLKIWDFVSTECFHIFSSFSELSRQNRINLSEKDCTKSNENVNEFLLNNEENVISHKICYSCAYKKSLANDQSLMGQILESLSNKFINQCDCQKYSKDVDVKHNKDILPKENITAGQCKEDVDQRKYMKVENIQQLYGALKSSALYLMSLVPSNAPSLTGITVDDNSIDQSLLAYCHTQPAQLVDNEFIVNNDSGFQSLQHLGVQKSVYEKKLEEEKLSDLAALSIQHAEDHQHLLSPECFENLKIMLETENPIEKLNVNSEATSLNTEVKKNFKFYRSISVGLNDSSSVASNLSETSQIHSKHAYFKTNNLQNFSRKHIKSSETLDIDTCCNKFNMPFLCKPSSRLLSLIKKCIDSNQESQYQTEEECKQIMIDSNTTLDVRSSLLSRSVFRFIFSCYNIDMYTLILKGAISAAAYRAIALNALNWLVVNVSSPVSLHDIMWIFVYSLLPGHIQENPLIESVLKDCKEENSDTNRLAQSTNRRCSHEEVCQHPFNQLEFAGESAESWVTESLHRFIKSISNLLPLLPMGSPLQQMAIRCFGIDFQPQDHIFLHECKVFSHISNILTRSSSDQDANILLNELDKSFSDKDKFGSYLLLSTSKDVTEKFEFKSSSRESMISSLVDNSTETFWESGNEDRNKIKYILISANADEWKEVNLENVQLKFACVYIDNTRDVENKVSHLSFKIVSNKKDAFQCWEGVSASNHLPFGCNELIYEKIRTFDVDSKFCGWIQCELSSQHSKSILSKSSLKIELNGPFQCLRIRQVKILSMLSNVDRSCVINDLFSNQSVNECKNSANLEYKKFMSATTFQKIQISNCESETLRVFRLLTSQVFGKLLANDTPAALVTSANGNEKRLSFYQNNNNENDLREHMVGILFAHSGKLSELQKQVCSHIVHEIHFESAKVREEWEASLSPAEDDSTIGVSKCHMNENSTRRIGSDEFPNDSYCFELLSLVLALSGSDIGSNYLSKQKELLYDILTLLHTSSDRVKRQVLALIRRVISNIKPLTFAQILGITELPNLSDIFAKTHNSLGENILNWRGSSENEVLCHVGVLDHLLSCIAKSLSVQTKIKGSSTGSRYQKMHSMDMIFKSKDSTYQQWWIRGIISRQISQSVITLLKDMIGGVFGKDWSEVARNCVTEKILNLTCLTDTYRMPDECIRTPTLWLALASLCVLDEKDAEMLSTSNLTKFHDQANGNASNMYCDNHDDGETIAFIQCNVCGNLCADCDRFLHLNTKTRTHKRHIFKEEADSIKVDIHEGCGRAKFFWSLTVADSRLLKAMVEFRSGNFKTNSVAKLCEDEKTSQLNDCYPDFQIGVCRFCGSNDATGLLAVGNVCSNEECQGFASEACTKTLPCGHFCGGILNEVSCLSCLHGCSGNLKQDGDDMCMICFSESLFSAPCIQLSCNHVFHFHCVRTVLETRWTGSRISFTFVHCPICKTEIEHWSLTDLLQPIKSLYNDVKRKALMRLEYEGLNRCEAIATPGMRFYNDPTGFALEKYSYYLCFKCDKAYFGGEARCDADYDLRNFNPEELICGSCSDVTQAQICPKHGTDFLEYKCRFCCSVAVYFCFGSTHFCKACHDDFQRLVSIKQHPKCPVGPRGVPLEGDECPLHVIHPPTGEEFALGCGICRNAHTF